MVDLSMANPAGSRPPGAGDDAVTERFKETRRLIRLGWAIIAMVFGGLLLWSVFAPFEGAVLTSGQITVESNQQAIQHLEGGIVRQIHVGEGDRVTAQQVLISLDATTSDAGLDSLDARLFSLLGTEARLTAERDGRSDLIVRPSFVSFGATPEMKAVLDAQASLMSARSEGRTTQGRILEQRVDQLAERIRGMRSEIESKDQQIGFITDEIERYEPLLEQGLIAAPRILALQRDRARILGEKDSLVSQIAATRVQIGEARSEISKLSQGFQEDVLTELRTVQTEIEQLTEERTAAVDRRQRLDIVAPRAGRVIGVRAHTVGGVITASEPVMYIVPDGDRLIAKVRIMPMDIDKVSIGQSATLRFSAFNMNESPEVDGTVETVSADALMDDATGMSYYEAIVAIPEASLASERFPLQPGMPVDVLVRTESRSVLSYLVKPLQDAMSRTFRE